MSPVTVDTLPILKGSQASALPPAARAGHPQRPCHTCAKGRPGQDPTQRRVVGKWLVGLGTTEWLVGPPRRPCSREGLTGNSTCIHISNGVASYSFS